MQNVEKKEGRKERRKERRKRKKKMGKKWEKNGGEGCFPVYLYYKKKIGFIKSVKKERKTENNLKKWEKELTIYITFFASNPLPNYIMIHNVGNILCKAFFFSFLFFFCSLQNVLYCTDTCIHTITTDMYSTYEYWERKKRKKNSKQTT